MFKTYPTVKYSYFLAKNMNLTKTFKIICLSGLYFFQLRDLKLPDLEKLQRNGQFYHYLVPLCGSKKFLSFTIKNTTSTIQIFFFQIYICIYIFCVPITSKKHDQKRGHRCRFIAKRQQRDNFSRLQMIILRDRNGASFKTNTFLAR